MRDVFKLVAIVVWLVVLVFGAYRFWDGGVQDRVYIGSEVVFTAGGNYDRIEVGSPATLKAGADGYFLLRKSTGEHISGIPADRPLGFGKGNFYQAGPTQVAQGLWLVEKGTPEIRVVSEKALVVTLKYNDTVRWAGAVLIGIIAILLWLAGAASIAKRS